MNADALIDGSINNWKETTLGQLITLHYGKALKTENRLKGDIPVYSSAGLTGYHNEALFAGKGIVVGRKGTVGKAYLTELPFWCIDTAYYILPDNQKYEFKYLYYLLRTLGLEELNEDSAVPGLNRDTAYQQQFLLPPLPEQKAIAAVLSSLDGKIDLLHRQNKTLEAMAETLFRQWFIEEAKEDWEKCCLGDCVTISYGRNLPTKNLVLEGYPVFGANGQIGFFTNYTYLDPQVLVSCRGEASGVVNISLAKSYITNNSLVLERNKKQIISFEFLKYWALSYDFNLHVSGSAQPQITIDGLYDAILNLPDEHLIRSYSSIVFHFEQKRSFNVQQIQTLEKLRDNLLPKLMSGEVRVSYEQQDAA